MPRFVISSVVLLALFVLHLSAQVTPPPPPFDEGKSLENEFSVSLTMFSTLAAINAAGYDTGIDSALNESYKVRTQIRELLAKQKPGVLGELKEFYLKHKKASEAADLGQYLSFALIAGDAPSFQLPSGEVPPDVEPLRGFSPILARFYKEANLQDVWTRSQPAYAAAMREYQDPVINTLFETNGYVRNASGYLGRRFQIYLDLLGAPNEIQVRSYRDDYYVVITPTASPVVDEVRDAYLAYLLDPLTFKYSSAIKEKKALAKYALDAPALDAAYKDDFSLLVTKSLIKAIDSRMLHGGDEKRSEFVNQAMREGFILTAAFADALPQYEKQPDAFRIYYPELIAAVNVRQEEKRLRKVEFAQAVKPKVIAPPAKMQIDPAEESLQTAQGLLEQKDLDNADRAFKKALGLTADKSLQGRAYYGMAVVALQEKRWDEALNLFGRVIESSPQSANAAWSHYYLGELHLKARELHEATAEFQLTLATEGVSAAAREAAEKALQQSSSPGDNNR